MPVLIRTLEILALLGALGFPVNLFLLTRIDHMPGRWLVSARLLLAPVTGLAVFSVFTGFYYAIKLPVADSASSYWVLLVALWLGALLDWRRSTSKNFPFHPSKETALSHGLVALCLAVILSFYLRPFWQDPSLVFWHYAGSDGYMYMRIAEHVASPGTGIIPTLGPFDGAAGFVAEEMRHFHAGTFIDKPGTMSTLAGLSALLNLTTLETFSPLTLAALAMIGSVLIIFGQSLLKLPLWASLGFAVLGTLAMPVWMLSTHTFYGNLLALPFYPLVLIAIRPVTTFRTSIYVGLLLAGQTLLFPDGELVMIGVLLVTMPFLIWTAWKRQRVRQLLYASSITIGTALLLTSPFGRGLYQTTFSRLLSVLSPAPRNAMQNTDSPYSLQLQSLQEVNWIWPAFNLNTIPPQSLLAGELPYVLIIAGLLVLFLGISLVKPKRIGFRLLPFVISFLLVLAIGLAGFFHSDYELFRALAVLSFLPLAAICMLPWLLTGYAQTKRATVVRFILLAALAPVLVHYLKNDLRQFNFAYEAHAVDAQYTTANLRDRFEISQLAKSHSIVLGTETPSFTAMANVMVLLSPVRLGLPKPYQKFVFFNDVGDRDVVYGADLLLRNLRYADISDQAPTVINNSPYYASTDFEVIENDLYPFFDNDSLPLLHGYPSTFLRQHNLAVARAWLSETEIAFHSRTDRSISIELEFAESAHPREFNYALDQGPWHIAVVPADGTLTLPEQAVEKGRHHLRLGSLANTAHLIGLHLQETDTGKSPKSMAGAWYHTVGFRPFQLQPFANMSPHPVRFFSAFGPEIYGEYYNAHPLTILCFQPPSGHRRLRTTLQFAPQAYEEAGSEKLTDGADFEIALLTKNGDRKIVLHRNLDPVRMASDRGELPIDVTFELPEGAEVEVKIGPGKNGQLNRDWVTLGRLVIE